MLVYDDIKSIIYIKKMDRLPKLAKVGYCCFLFFFLALASILGYIIANQGIDITHKIDEANCIQQTSISVISCSQICRNKYSYFSIEQSDSCCTLDSSCMLKTICKDDLVSSERMEINSMLTNLYFECGFLGFIAFIVLVFMCYKFAKRKQQQSRLLAQNDNIQERIQSILDRINNCQEPLIAGTKQQLNPSQFADNVNDVCPICLEEFQERKVIKMDCAHVFHSRCIEQWITVNARCPVCRTRL